LGSDDEIGPYGIFEIGSNFYTPPSSEYLLTRFYYSIVMPHSSHLYLTIPRVSGSTSSKSYRFLPCISKHSGQWLFPSSSAVIVRWQCRQRNLFPGSGISTNLLWLQFVIYHIRFYITGPFRNQLCGTFILAERIQHMMSKF